MKRQQEELHKLREVLSLAEEDLKKEQERKTGLFQHVLFLQVCALHSWKHFSISACKKMGV